MANIISCPACARKLSVNPELPAEQLFKCPACQAVFALPAKEVIVRRDDDHDRPRVRRSDGDFAEKRLQPILPRENDSPDESSHGSNWDEDDWPEIRRSVKKERSKRSLVLALSGGFLALLVLVVGAILFVGRSDSAIVGSWKGTLQFAVMNDVDCTYRFHQDGTVVDEHVDPGTRLMIRAKGRYTFANGVVNIHWPDGEFERASVRRTGPNTIEYVILAHTDGAQIGGKATFSRVVR